jgi:hypothetical protein
LNRKQAKISLDKEGNAFIKKIINQKGIEKWFVRSVVGQWL